ncbi:MAG: urease accessory protein UreD [Terrimicrobiaceae bacterium]
MHLSKPYWDGNHLIINVVNPTAGLFAGDSVDVGVQVCPGARVVLTSPSATRVFRARDSSGEAQWVQSFVVESGGRLDVFPEILIAHAGARYRQTTRIDVRPGGELFLTEMIAPGRTASGESFLYDRLEFSLDLFAENQLVARERYRLTPKSPSIQAIARRFPNAYYASTLLVSSCPADDSLQRAINALNTPHVLAGASRPARTVYAIKLVAADSVSLRRAVAAVRAIGYSHLGWPEPFLRKL